MGRILKPWEVMKAHSNGANIEHSEVPDLYWNHSHDPQWDWSTKSYRVSDRTADGYQINEFIHKIDNPEEDIIYQGAVAPYKTINCFIEEITNFPNKISHFRLNKKAEYRPYTWEEREILRNNWVVNKKTGAEYLIYIMDKDSNGNLLANGTSAIDLLEKYTFLDGSPIGAKS